MNYQNNLQTYEPKGIEMTTNEHQTKPYILGRPTLANLDQTWAEMEQTEPGNRGYPAERGMAWPATRPMPKAALPVARGMPESSKTQRNS